MSKKEAVFGILDSDSDHHLNQGELFIVGKELFGFDGSDNEWQETYEALRNDFGFPEEGMDLSTFDKVLSASEESFPTGDHLEDDLLKASHEYAVHLKDHTKECPTLQHTNPNRPPFRMHFCFRMQAKPLLDDFNINLGRTNPNRLNRGML